MYKPSIALVAVALAFGMSHSFAAEPSQAELAAQARVSHADAEKTALAKVPQGVVKSAELEREHGKLVWSFDIAQAARQGVTEIQVDALSGAIVSVKRESASAEAKEAAAEAKGK
ncbi:PepSY domain-containing protein [Ramlibacter sp.]|uniref:PepSY domain-containing protein n=1 Tax=Ramlibacter sp. TaxID=1917967 RepID=UPI0026399514|nr:PepSY domain-containing protein [Ramlibacter sp.]MDB5956510.1 peptidase [Ramlibacter sp.]